MDVQTEVGGGDVAKFKIPFQIYKRRNEYAALSYRVRDTKEAIPSQGVTTRGLGRVDTFLVRGNVGFLPLLTGQWSMT